MSSLFLFSGRHTNKQTRGRGSCIEEKHEERKTESRFCLFILTSSASYFFFLGRLCLTMKGELLSALVKVGPFMVLLPMPNHTPRTYKKHRFFFFCFFLYLFLCVIDWQTKNTRTRQTTQTHLGGNSHRGASLRCVWSKKSFWGKKE